MNIVYVFSGLGVDKRIFNDIDFGELRVVFVDWIMPEKRETLQAYALRLSEVIKTEKPILLGLSFGGMVAVEISKRITCEKVILIASAMNYKEFPAFYRWFGFVKLHKMIPVELLKKRTVFTDWAFGLKSKKDRCLMDAVLMDTDSYFLKWALNAVLNWKEMSCIAEVFRIHGTKDRIIPLKNVKADYTVKDGGHFMTVNNAEEISGVIKNVCGK